MESEEEEEEKEEEEEFVGEFRVLKKNDKYTKPIEYSQKEDVVIQSILQNEDAEQEEELPSLKPPKTYSQPECDHATEENIKHTNYFCMKVVKEELEVKPIDVNPELKRPARVEETAPKKSIKPMERKKNETSEEKKQRKELVKQIKNQKKEKKWEKKQKQMQYNLNKARQQQMQQEKLHSTPNWNN